MAKKAAPVLTRISITGNKRSGTRGFTMLELLMVLSIMLILSGVVAVAITPALRNASLRASTLMVIAQLQFARSYAVANQTETAVQFDTQKNGIAVVMNAQQSTQANAPALNDTPDATQGTDASITWQVVTTPAGRFRTLPDGITINAVNVNGTVGASTGTETSAQYITFSPLGQGEAATIVLQDDQGIQRTIQVDALTGRCDIVDNQNGQLTNNNQ